MLKHLTALIIIATNLCFALPISPQYEVVGVYVIDGNTNVQQNFENRRCSGQNCAYNPNQPYIQYPHHNHPQPGYKKKPAPDTIIVLVPEDDFGAHHTFRHNPAYHMTPTQPTFNRPNRPVARPTPLYTPNGNSNSNYWHNYPTAVPPTRPTPKVEFHNVPTFMPKPERNDIISKQRPNYPINENSNQGLISKQRPNYPINENSNQGLNQNTSPPVPVEKQSSFIKSTTSRSSLSDDKSSIDDTIADVFGPKKPDLPVYDLDVRMDS